MPLVMSILAALPTIQVGVEHLIAYIRTAKPALQATGEWTAEADELWEAELVRRASAPAYQPDKP